MTTRKAGDPIDDQQAGVIQLGADSNETLQVVPIITGERQIEIHNEFLELLRSIDESLKTLLLHTESISS